jgi:hypothetical protein
MESSLSSTRWWQQGGGGGSAADEVGLGGGTMGVKSGDKSVSFPGGFPETSCVDSKVQKEIYYRVV